MVNMTSPTVIKFLSFFLVFTTVVASPSPKSAFFRGARQRHQIANTPVYKRASEAASCSNATAELLDVTKSNIWQGLTDIEAANVTTWVWRHFNLTAPLKATNWDNTVLLVELMEPNKSLALDYLDNGGPIPERYARVLLDHRSSLNPHFQDILVGPLPVSNATKWEPLTYPYTRKTNGKIRNLNADDSLLYTDWFYPIGKSIVDITLDLWNGSMLGLDNDTLDAFGIDPLWQEQGTDSIINWVGYWSLPTTDFDTETLLPLGLYFKSNMTGRDPSKWSLDGWLYNGIFYNTTDDFRKAFYSPGFVKHGANVDGPWASTDQQGKELPLDTKYPASLVAPAGDRFLVNKEQKFVQWQDFTFYIAFTRDTGLRLYDIHYKGKRIIYELGLQEALAHYAGNDPVQSGTSYLDSFYGFGPYSFELVSGYDCPSYSTYLNSSFYIKETTHTHPNSICLFEMDAGYPMQRHSSGHYVAITKNIFFTVRNVCTVGNYDYAFSYEFYMDGSIHVEVRASGYIQAAYWAQNEDYGYHIHDSLSGSMHDHVLNFKIDFDILGTNNTMTTVTPKAVSEVYPWSNGEARNTMKLERSIVANEDESKLHWGANAATQYKVVNLDALNNFGEARGYRVLPSSPTIHLTIKNSTNLAEAARWSEYDIYVTKQKDTEQRSSHPYNSQDVFNPMINFNDYFDGENLTQTDIVLWINLGMHHVPHTGDLPNTVFTTAHSGLHIMPLNYLSSGDPSRQTVNMVRINYDQTPGLRPNTSNTTVTYFGQALGSCTLNFTPPEVDLNNYIGDVDIRKFPYDPNDPFYKTGAVFKRSEEEMQDQI